MPASRPVPGLTFSGICAVADETVWLTIRASDAVLLLRSSAPWKCQGVTNGTKLRGFTLYPRDCSAPLHLTGGPFFY